ncbi:MAG: hypothetical protein PHS07_03520 [Patescibacteria group bacterium]|nr:hypothetical protein [Patescibacteria group bacterium]
MSENTKDILKIIALNIPLLPLTIPFGLVLLLFAAILKNLALAKQIFIKLEVMYLRPFFYCSFNKESDRWERIPAAGGTHGHLKG